MHLHRLCLTAHKQIESELKLLELKQINPERFEPIVLEETISPLHWKGTPTELSELLTSLHIIKCITLASGKVAPFTQIVKSFEKLFNIKLGDPRDLKRDIISRNTKRTVFIDRLKRSLLNDEF